MESTLAISGGSPVRTKEFPPWPSFESEECHAANQVLKSGKVNYWTGEEGKLFESEFAAATGVRHAIALANGSLALDLALTVLNIGPGDEVIVTPRSFMASVSCVVLRGAKPIFAEVDRESQNITAATIAKVITPKTKAVIPVHLAGWPCEMDAIMALAKKHNFYVIEDCAQAHGATFKNSFVGSMGHLSAFSFCQDKIFTTGGEGGMLTTNDSELWDKAWSFKDHGKSFDTIFNVKRSFGFAWLNESFGTNMRLTEFQSAMGRVLLRKLNSGVERRRELAHQLNHVCSEFPSLRITVPPAEVKHSYYKFYAFVKPEELRNDWTRDRICQAITAEGIPCLVGSCSEIYLEKAFSSDLRPAQRLPVAQELGETSIMFLVHPTISDGVLEDMCSAIRKVMSVATK